MNESKNSMNEQGDPFAAFSDAEVRILPPDYALKKLIGEDVDIKQIFSPENIEKAQAVINEHKESFVEWVMKDIALLQESYDRLAANPPDVDAEVRKLARAAFIIKSQAGTFGFQLATQVAKSLDDFCTKHFHPSAGHMMVIRKHIDTLTTIFRKNITGDGGALGKELSGSLFKLADKFKDK